MTVLEKLVEIVTLIALMTATPISAQEAPQSTDKLPEPTPVVEAVVEPEQAAVVAPPASTQTQTILVIATNYTCENHPLNPMYPCGPLRWGGDIWSAGMACPVQWKDRWFRVPGYGTLRCDDTGAYDYWDGLPHIDIRVATYDGAMRFGVQRMEITEVR